MSRQCFVSSAFAATKGIWEYFEGDLALPPEYVATMQESLAPCMAATAAHDHDDCVDSTRVANLLFGCLSVANGLKNAFVLVQISRFQQIIGVYTLQAPSEVAKVSIGHGTS